MHLRADKYELIFRMDEAYCYQILQLKGMWQGELKKNISADMEGWSAVVRLDRSEENSW